jgi:hypothetical protein
MKSKFKSTLGLIFEIILTVASEIKKAKEARKNKEV